MSLSLLFTVVENKHERRPSTRVPNRSISSTFHSNVSMYRENIDTLGRGKA